MLAKTNSRRSVTNQHDIHDSNPHHQLKKSQQPAPIADVIIPYYFIGLL